MNKKVVIIRNAFEFDFGGGERMPVNIASELKKHKVEAIIVSKNTRLLEYAHSKDVETIHALWWSRQDWSGIKILLTPIYFAWLLMVFFWYLRLFIRLKPDIVHVQSKDDFISATLAGKLLGKKIVWSDHADLKYIYENLRVCYKNPIGKLVKFCDRFVSVIIMTGKSDVKLTEKAIGSKLPDKYKIIYNGVFDKPELLKIKKEKKLTFVSTSRLVTAKGMGELVTAFDNLSKTNDQIQLWILGEGPEEDKFKKMAKGNNRIKFLGFPENALEYVAKAHIFVHPSYLEGFSISVIEATMLGLPVIACDVGGNPEIINDKNGMLIKEKDVSDLQNAMQTLLNDEKQRKLKAENSRRTFVEGFDFSNIIKDKYLDIYESK